MIIVWGCELKKVRLDETIDQVAAEIEKYGEVFRVAQKARRKAWDEYRLGQRSRKEKRENPDGRSGSRTDIVMMSKFRYIICFTA